MIEEIIIKQPFGKLIFYIGIVIANAFVAYPLSTLLRANILVALE
jgi:hypothetical protein